MSVRVREFGVRNANVYLRQILSCILYGVIFQRKKEIQPYLKREVQGKDYEKPLGFKTDEYFEASFRLPPNDQLMSSTEEESND